MATLTDANSHVQNNVVLKEIGYDPTSNLKRWEKDGRGFVTEYQQDVLGRQIATVYPDDDDPASFYPTVVTGPIDRSDCRSDNPCQTVTYNDSARSSTVIDPLGNRTDYFYDSFEHLVEIDKFKHDASGALVVYSRVQVQYDNLGNIAAIISPNGTANPSQAAQYTTSYQYDEVNRLQKIIYPYDQTLNGNPTKFYDYNDVENSVTVTDENGNQTLIQKDAVDRVILQDLGLGHEEETSTAYTYDALNNKTAATDGRGNTTLFVYDDLNHLIQKILPSVNVVNDPTTVNPTVTNPQCNYDYDQEGNLFHETSPLGTVTTHNYDELNREIRTATNFTAMNGVQRTDVTSTFYDLAGNKTQVSDANGKSTTSTYSARGWLLSKTDPNGGVSSFTYDLVGNKISETDPRGNQSGAATNSFTAWYWYDDLYRIVKAVLPDQTPPSDPNNPGDNPVITFTYDYNGNCLTETQANGQVINYAYDGRNRLLSQSESLNGKTYTSKFEYDGVGNKRFVFDNLGNKTEYQYDALNRVFNTIFPQGNTMQYGYDQDGNKVKVIDGVYNETDSTFDALNRLSTVTDAAGGVTSYWYNGDGKMTMQQSANNLVTKYFLNELGLPLQVVDSLGQSRAFDYDAVGNVIYKQDPRGTVTTIQYDDMYRILQTNLQNGSQAQSLNYQYDIVGNVTQSDNGQVKLIYNNSDSNYISDPFNRIYQVAQVMPDNQPDTPPDMDLISWAR